VKYSTAAAFRTALEDRLKREQSEGVGVSRLRKRVVFERLLARLQVVAPDGWCLKGGFALELRLGIGARTTKDIDIDWTVGATDATELLLDAVACDLDDGFAFDVRRDGSSDDLAGGGQRWSVRGELAGRLFEVVAVDVGFDKPPVVGPEHIVTSRLLEFADIEPITVPVLAIEQHVAEKLHAYTRTYADGQSSRVKDLVDMVVIAHTATVDATRLWTGVTSIFARRASHEVPDRLPAPPTDWARPWATLVKHLPAESDLRDGYMVAAGFWAPVLGGNMIVGTWIPTATAWRADG
jgi:predicted nucleotidyltransferase component of viral defense system